MLCAQRQSFTLMSKKAICISTIFVKIKFWFVALTYFLVGQLLVLILRNELAQTVQKFSPSLSVSSQQIKSSWGCAFLLSDYKLPLCAFNSRGMHFPAE